MNKNMTKLALAGLLAIGLGAMIARAEDTKDAPKKDAYPLKTCVVSGESLDDMGDPVIYMYKKADGTEREIRFCCKKCIKKFEQDPDTYLKKLDDAAAAKSKDAPEKAVPPKTASAMPGCGTSGCGMSGCGMK